MNIESLVTEIGIAIGQPVEWHEDATRIEFDDGVEVFVEHFPDSGRVFLFSPVASIPELEAPRYALGLLKANLLGRETGGFAVFAYDDEAEQVVLWDSFDLAGMETEHFTPRLHLFRAAAGAWSDIYLERLMEDATDGDDASDDLDIDSRDTKRIFA